MLLNVFINNENDFNLIHRRIIMFNKKILSILIASIVVTACAGNNVKLQESPAKQQQETSKNLEVTTHSEIVLSDFPTQEVATESTIKLDTESTNQATVDKAISSTGPKIKVVNFTFDKFEITEENKVLLKQHAEYLTDNPSYVLTVNGHSDYRGPEVYNEKLSLRRANSVASILISYGASESQLIINSFGSSKPVEDYDNWFQNRRVELEYSELYMVSK